MDTFDRFMIGFFVLALLGLSSIANYRAEKLENKAKIQDVAHGILAEELRATKAELSEVKARLDGFIKEYNAVASWYGPGFHGKRAADGSVYDQMAFTAAHKTLPFGTIVIFEANGKRVPAIITDRGPFVKGRDFDLSRGLADRLGLVKAGVAAVAVYEISIR